jgi:Flp pilus assembly protein TadG
MVELALVLPVLLIVVLAIVDFGRAIDYMNAENHIANLAARYGAIGSLPTTGVCANKTSLQAYITCEVTADAPELNGGSGPGP